ncbi:MAG: hypothetical protein LBB78_11355 [Spirochaetaceae bacterium]|jgi:hypothetical protein|nr:hypothetical protein [Spirochaetaceae bacterium]
MCPLKNFLFLIVGSLALFACATKPDVYKDIDVNINAEAYDQALGIITSDRESKKPIYPEKNLIMYYLDKGIVEHYAGKYKESAADLEEAERLIEEAYTKSVIAETSSFVVKDNTRDYAGEDYEDLYTNVFNALNYYHNGDIEGAGVEVRQMTEKLVRLEDKYAGDSGKAKEALAETINLMGGKTIELPSGTPVQVSDTALGRYLSAIIYRSLGQNDSARIDIEAISVAYAKAPAVYTNPIPAWINDELAVPADKARLNILAFAGLSPVKEEEIIIVPSFFQYATYTGPYLSSLEKSRGIVLVNGGLDFQGILLHLPHLVPRPSIIDRIEVDVNGTKLDLDLLEDMGAVMTETFNAKYSSTLIKTFVRTVIKGGALEAAAQEALQNNKPEVAVKMTAMSGMVAFDKTEAADTRSSRYLPGKAYAGGITLNPGTYTVAINYYSGGSVVHSVERSVDVSNGKLNLVEAFSLK